jgi:type I restriction-modification system DNA methylase subunit
MSAHSSTSHALHKRDLQACIDVPSVFTLFHKLRYPVENRPIHVPLDRGELPAHLHNDIAARYLVAKVGGTYPGESRVSVTLFELKGQTRKNGIIRGVAQAWTRRLPGEHLLVFTVNNAPDQNEIGQLAFVNTRRVGEGAQVRIKLHKLLVERSNPTRHDLDTLNSIALPAQGISAERLYQIQCEAFNVERLTNNFYREYARRFRAMQERIKQDNPDITAFSDPTRLHTFTQRLFGRLMFLYFLQKKKALDDDLQFIKGWYEKTARQEENFYRSVLEPLFFDTLNLPRLEMQSPFGQVPYLNGGLFAPDEDDHVGQVFLANALFDIWHTDGLLYFLENHNFTIEEDTPLEVEVALDPEMLGKVFENLLEVEERGKSGTFYTPRPVVTFMCRKALASYLTHEVPIPDETLSWLLDEAETDEPVLGSNNQPLLDAHSLPRPLRERVERALEQVRVLDPAVGSGAFLLGMLALLVGVRRTLYRVAGVTMDRRTSLVQGWKRNFIRDCLYGVDIKREAIEIARLRLWLSLVVDEVDPSEMEPLPNLDFKLIAGDSLVEAINGMAIYPTRPDTSKISQLSLTENETQQLIHRLHELKDAYFQPEKGQSASSLKQEIVRMERRIVLEALQDRNQQNQERLNLLSTSVMDARRNSMVNHAQIETLRCDIQTTQQAIADLEAGKTLPLFLYRLHFAGVFEEKNGFDIVIANPPYVRHEQVPRETLKTLKATYPDVQHGMADLYVYFYARVLELLHDGGTLAFISSNKFFRTGYGKGLRDLLAKQTQAQIILDFGDTPVFDAAAYPCIVLTAKGKPPSDYTYRGLTADNHIDLEKLNTIFDSMAQALPQTQGIYPPNRSSSTTALMEKLMSTGTPLKRYINGRMYYGIKTGLNKAFVVDQATRDHLVAEDQSSADVLKPLLRGRDLARYAIHSAGLWLICIESGWTLTAMGTRKKPSEAQAWEFFANRYPTIARHLEPFAERARKRDDQGQFWWELRPCVYYQEFEKPKIVYPDIAAQSKFSWDKSGFYVNNTSYCLPIGERYLCALLNSSLMAYLYDSLSPQIGGSFYRFIAQYMERLPIVEPSLEDQRRLVLLVDQLQALGGQGPEAAFLEHEVDTIVYRTYGLTEEEIAEIEHWHEERRSQLGTDRHGTKIIVEEAEA